MNNFTIFVSGNMLGEEDEDDPDALCDPLYNVNLKKYLIEFLAGFSKQPYFHPHFSQHITQQERQSLESLGIQL